MAREKARGYAGGPQAAHSASPMRGGHDTHADGLLAVFGCVWVEIIDELKGSVTMYKLASKAVANPRGVECSRPGNHVVGNRTRTHLD
eukprot:1697977-Prymnesium_polylepis.1